MHCSPVFWHDKASSLLLGMKQRTRFSGEESLSKLESRLVRQVYFVYIMASLSGTLYVGYSNNLQRRRAQHSIGSPNAFTARYKVDCLVYFETYTDIRKAQFREKQIKSWRREKKIALIRSMNPSWLDLSKDLLGRRRASGVSILEHQLLAEANGHGGDSSRSESLDLQHWQVEQIEAGLADADAGRLIAHSKVKAMAERWRRSSLAVRLAPHLARSATHEGEMAQKGIPRFARNE
jgi:putative endonuclease